MQISLTSRKSPWISSFFISMSSSDPLLTSFIVGILIPAVQAPFGMPFLLRLLSDIMVSFSVRGAAFEPRAALQFCPSHPKELLERTSCKRTALAPQSSMQHGYEYFEMLPLHSDPKPAAQMNCHFANQTAGPSTGTSKSRSHLLACRSQEKHRANKIAHSKLL